jgi:VWFA-related protein
VLAVLAVPALFSLSFGQGAAPASKPVQTDVVNVNEVTLNLAVRGKKDKPVADLKPEDIAVTDGGVPVRISSLRRVEEDDSEHLVTLMFDRLDLAASHNARDIAAKILKLVPEKAFSFCVLKTEGRLMLYQDFSADRAALTKSINSATDADTAEEKEGAASPEKRLIAIARTGSDDSGKSVTAMERTTDQVLLAALQESQRLAREQHAPPSLAGLLALARTQRKLPGRKVVIYFAQDLHFDATSDSMLRYIIESANRSDVSIYAIDANALTAQADQSMVAMMAIGNARAASAQAGPAATTTGSGAGTQSVAQPSPGIATMVGNQMDRYESADPNANKSPLVDLAERTGGAYLAPGENLKKHFRQMVADMTSGYEASYASPVTDFNGKFRPIAVKSHRSGLKIHSRAGYYALPPDPGTSVRPFEAPLLKILGESQLPADLKFRAAILHLGDLPNGDENALVVEVPVSELDTRDDPNTNLYSLHVSIVAQIKNKAGVVVQHFSEDIPQHGSLGPDGSGRSEVVTMQRHFVADPGQYVMEAAILDRNSGKASAQRTEFEVPSEPAGPSLSDVAVVQRMDPLPAAEMDSAEPLQYGNSKVVAGISGRVPHGTKNISFYFVVHPDADSTDPPRLEMEVLKSKESIAQVPLQLRKTVGPVSIPYVASIQAASLPSGDYEVIEKLTQGGKTVERAVAFRIEGPELARADGPGATAAPSDDAAPVSASQPQPDSGRQLVITSLPDGVVPPPSTEQLEAMVAGARKRALDYSKSLPNFMCVEMTNRSVDQSGNGNWKHRDSLAEMLTYHEGHETRSTLEVNGARSSLTRTELNSSWPLSVGEFGALLNLIFLPSSKTQFEWKEAATLGDGTGTVQVLKYRVARENATIDLGQGNETVGVGFHGLVYVDAATSGVRRVTLQADDLPKNFSMRAASMTVDYDFVAIGGRDYLLPVRSTVSLQRGHKKIELNEIAFRNYRRFASRAKIKFIQ